MFKKRWMANRVKKGKKDKLKIVCLNLEILVAIAISFSKEGGKG